MRSWKGRSRQHSVKTTTNNEIPAPNEALPCPDTEVPPTAINLPCLDIPAPMDSQNEIPSSEAPSIVIDIPEAPVPSIFPVNSTIEDGKNKTPKTCNVTPDCFRHKLSQF